MSIGHENPKRGNHFAIGLNNFIAEQNYKFIYLIDKSVRRLSFWWHISPFFLDEMISIRAALNRARHIKGQRPRTKWRQDTWNSTKESAQDIGNRPSKKYIGFETTHSKIIFNSRFVGDENIDIELGGFGFRSREKKIAWWLGIYCSLLRTRRREGVQSAAALKADPAIEPSYIIRTQGNRWGCGKLFKKNPLPRGRKPSASNKKHWWSNTIIKRTP